MKRWLKSILPRFILTAYHHRLLSERRTEEVFSEIYRDENGTANLDIVQRAHIRLPFNSGVYLNKPPFDSHVLEEVPGFGRTYEPGVIRTIRVWLWNVTSQATPMDSAE